MHTVVRKVYECQIPALLRQMVETTVYFREGMHIRRPFCALADKEPQLVIGIGTFQRFPHKLVDAGDIQSLGAIFLGYVPIKFLS